jgi:beta-mannosidase
MKPVSIEANSSRIFFSLPLAELRSYNKNRIVFTCALRGIGGNQLPSAYHYFVPPKDLDLAKPKISMRWLSDDRIELSTDVLAKNLFLFCEESVQFEDNFFDLLPGEMKIVNLKGATKKQSVIKIKSLADTY